MQVLMSPDLLAKISKTRLACQLWRAGSLQIGRAQPPPEPVNPPRPELRNARAMPNWKALGVTNAVFLLHGLAHIELNAVQLCWDTMLRASLLEEPMPREFFADQVDIADDEARHFSLLDERLRALGSSYGALPAHDKLWKIASSNLNLRDRIAMVQLVQEARALDSHDRLVAKLSDNKANSKLVDMICTEEVGHVKKGVRWFEYLCARDGIQPIPHFHQLIRSTGTLLPPPFNQGARDSAGLSPEYYLPVELKRVHKQGGHAAQAAPASALPSA
jgi:uncharacterized ferritin-like protein (DUF455 family)